ncbi:MAG TPA: ABC transporter ATP-binding protein [Tepidisphaeraceae bacterium]|jgi:ATP-binding cassette subfamily B protein/subfamily B ATP-binding cassette protein MsbA
MVGEAKRYRPLMRYVAAQWRALPVIVLLSTVGPLFTSLAPWPLKILVDRALGGNWGEETASFLDRVPLPADKKQLLLVAGAASVGLFLLGSLLEAATTWLWSLVGQKMVRELAADLFAKLQRLSPTFHHRHSVGDVLSRLSGDAWCSYTLVESLLITPWQNVATLVWVGVLASLMDWKLTLLSFGVAPGLAVVAKHYGPRIMLRAKMGRQNESKLFSLVHQTISSISIVQAFGTQSRNRQQFEQLADAAISLSLKHSLLKNTYALVTGLLTTTGVAIVLFFGAKRVMEGALSVGGLLVFVAYLRAMQGAASGLFATHGAVKTVQASMDRVLEILNCDEQVKEKAGAKALRFEKGRGLAVQFENVTFGYEAGREILRDISLEVAAGETVALVGPTGAGKSTLVSLIPRLFDPWEGRVVIGGFEISDLKISDLRRAVAVVPQEPVLLPVSVAENIAYGRADASREEVVAAAEAAHASEFIEKMSAGYDTIIGERGATLSAGQRQRIAIARALLRDAAVLVLDEPTSALDAESEKLVMSALRRLCEGKTCFIIAHRLWTLREVDHVVTLEQGRIVEPAAAGVEL